MSKKREKANDRERSRMADVRVGFKELRKCIPGKFAPTYKHLPKIQILNFAMSYISELSQILQSDEKEGIDVPHPSSRLETKFEIFVEEAADFRAEVLTPPASEAEEEATGFKLEMDPIIFEVQSPTSQSKNEIFAQEGKFEPQEYVNALGRLTLVSQSSPETLPGNRVIDTEEYQGIGAPLMPTSSEEDFNLEDYLDEGLFAPVTISGNMDNSDLTDYPDFSDLLTPTECDEILSHIV